MKKKKSTTKKVSKTKHEVVIQIKAPTNVRESDLTPIKDGGKYMIPHTWLSERQVVRMVQQTPPKHIYTRPGKGGQTFTYVTGNYVEKVLNYVFGWAWDFEIIAHGREGNQVWVQGKLTVKDDKGHSITKSQFGRADIKQLKTGGNVDFGNDLKAASTDALKKCASLLGIASDVYGRQEFKQEAGMEVQTDKPQIEAPKISTLRDEPVEDYICAGFLKGGCGNDITKQEADFSKKMFGKHLCRNCQKLAKENKK